MNKKNSQSVIGRGDEITKIRACFQARRNVLLEGPVGIGKTFLALSLIEELGAKSFRVDGDSRYTEQKLAGWFDPPLVLKDGYSEKSFVPGPLVEAMRAGGVLFINELNRLPEGVQNILLPAIDERIILVPRLGEIRASAGFIVVATQNPKEFVATSHLSEAILDRFELIDLGYQSEDDERDIVRRSLKNLGGALGKGEQDQLVRAAVRFIRLTRGHSRLRRGASVRAAQSIVELTAALGTDGGGSFANKFIQAVLIAGPTRVELEPDVEESSSEGRKAPGRVELREVLENIARQALTETEDEDHPNELKKKR